MAHMKTPQYRSNLQQLLEQEKVTSDDGRLHSGPFLCILGITSSFLLLQQKHRDLSGQVEQLHSVCQSHKDRIKGLFQTKLDEVGVMTGCNKHTFLTVILFHQRSGLCVFVCVCFNSWE